MTLGCILKLSFTLYAQKLIITANYVDSEIYFPNSVNWCNIFGLCHIGEIIVPVVD